MKLPDGVIGMADRGPDWATWVHRLPALVRDLHDDWELRPDGSMTHGYVGLVVPVLTADGKPAMLKVSFPHEESAHEHLALQRWGGNGAVRLLRADPSRSALLLERLHREDLNELWDLEACEIVAGLWSRIHVPASPQFRTLSSYVERTTADLARLPRGAPLPRRMVEQVISLGRDFVADERTDGTLIHTDLHYGNVLAADREPWLVIDPKPLSGDPHYEVAPMLWNRYDEMAGDLRGGVRRRFHTLIDSGGLDEDRARDWVVVRMLHNALWALRSDDRASAETGAYLTQCVAIAKAVQD